MGKWDKNPIVARSAGGQIWAGGITDHFRPLFFGSFAVPARQEKRRAAGCGTRSEQGHRRRQFRSDRNSAYCHPPSKRAPAGLVQFSVRCCHNPEQLAGRSWAVCNGLRTGHSARTEATGRSERHRPGRRRPSRTNIHGSWKTSCPEGAAGESIMRCPE